MKPLLKISMTFMGSASMMLLALSPLQSQTEQAGSSTEAQATPAPAGFDNLTNGLVSQTVFKKNLDIFAEQEGVEEGLGPVFNGRGCADCHASPVIGGASQITEFRAAKMNGGYYEEHPGGTLIHDRAVDPSIQERLMEGYEIRAQRVSPSVLGDGYVEAIADATLEAIANAQPASMRGYILRVPVLEANNALRIGRFGWKNQHASLESFSADAYLNEMGITTPVLPTENTSNGNPVYDYDSVADPEDDGADVRIFAEFMRATKVPPRDEALAATAAAQSGEQIFKQVGCVTCHVASIVTAPTGETINGGAFTVPPALGNKRIHPFSDFLLHDVGTGDGIIQGTDPATRNRIRTAPLWGLRTRTRLMHDGQSPNPFDAVLRHRNEAQTAIRAFRTLSSSQLSDLLTFLNSL